MVDLGEEPPFHTEFAAPATRSVNNFNADLSRQTERTRSKMRNEIHFFL